MDDFAGAYLARKNDISVLSKYQQHTVAVFHLGGIAVECRLKSLLLLYHKIDSFNQKSKRVKNKIVENPSHNLSLALSNMQDFNERAKSDRLFLNHLGNIRFPLGATEVDYINLRYIAQTTQSQDDWQKSFDYVCGWLEKNEKTIL